MGTIVAWLLEKLTGKIALPIMVVMLVANIGTGIALEITRITLQHRTEDLAAEKATHAADIATYQAATAQAKALDQQHALTVKEGQDQVTTEKQHDLENQLASARAVAANFVRQHPAPAAIPSRRDNAPVPAAPDASGSVDGTSSSTVIPATDADACAITYTVAKGWQEWWAKEQPLWQAGSMPTAGAIVPIDAVDTKIVKRSELATNLAFPIDRDAVKTGSGQTLVSGPVVGNTGVLGSPINLLSFDKSFSVPDANTENVDADGPEKIQQKPS